MRLLITGSHGQVGTALVRQSLDLGYDIKGVDCDELDITDDGVVDTLIGAFKPDAVINAAAYTAVDRAEDEIDIAYAVNQSGPENLAKVCTKLDIPLIHYSTDYVFDGSKSGAYKEGDSVAPLGIYGGSKLAGEAAVAKYCSRHFILRTSWVFSASGNNFVKTMLRLGDECSELGVVFDQFGKPTSAEEIARVTLNLLEKCDDTWGIYHLAQPNVTSWHGFAEAIFAEARAQSFDLKINNVKAIATSDYPTAARRPVNSELNCDRLESVFGVRIRPWRESLAEVIRELRSV